VWGPHPPKKPQLLPFAMEFPYEAEHCLHCSG
jgi:hypothetical protein